MKINRCPNCVKKISEDSSICPYCGGSLSVHNEINELPIGTMLSDRFYVGRSLRQGGFGITYVGCDTKIEKKIAIKEFFPSSVANRISEYSENVSVTAGENQTYYENEKAKFVREARILAEFSGDRNIVGVTDICEEHNTAYLIMDFVEGEDLDVYLQNGHRFSYREAVDRMHPLVKSLEKIHQRNLIHRDISPSNIKIQNDGLLVLLDFGSARKIDDGGSREKTVVIKEGYAPIEQYTTSGNQGAWTDVYSLCATIYKMITGITPESPMNRKQNDTLVSAIRNNANLKDVEKSVLIKGLEINPEDRFQSMRELEAEMWSLTIPMNNPAIFRPSIPDIVPTDPTRENNPEQRDMDSEGDALPKDASEDKSFVGEEDVVGETGAKRCPQRDENNKQVNATSSLSRNRHLVGILAVVGVVCIALLIYIIVSRGDSPSVTDETEAETSSEDVTAYDDTTSGGEDTEDMNSQSPTEDTDAETESDSSEITSIGLSGADIILTGDDIELTVQTNTMTLSRDSDNLEWWSDDESVATVESGVITGHSEGYAGIFVAYNDLKAVKYIQVVDPANISGAELSVSMDNLVFSSYGIGAAGTNVTVTPSGYYGTYSLYCYSSSGIARGARYSWSEGSDGSAIITVIPLDKCDGYITIYMTPSDNKDKILAYSKIAITAE